MEVFITLVLQNTLKMYFEHFLFNTFKVVSAFFYFSLLVKFILDTPMNYLI